MPDKPSLWALAGRSSSMRIGAGLVGHGLLFVIFVGLDAIQGRSNSGAHATLWMAACLALIGAMLVAIGVRRGLVRRRVLTDGLAGLRRVWIWHRLVGHGVRVTGTVSAVKWAMFANGGWGRGIAEWQQIIRYRYEDESGHAHQGRSGFLSSPEASRSRVGDRCDIRIDRERQASSVWIGAVD